MRWLLSVAIGVMFMPDAHAEPIAPQPLVHVLWVAPQSPVCRAQVGKTALVLEDCATRAERAVQDAFLQVSREQTGGWRFDVTVPGFRVRQDRDELVLTLDLAVTEPVERRALLRASGQSRVLLEPGMTQAEFAERVTEALTSAAHEGALLLRNRVSMPSAELSAEAWPKSWLGLEARTPGQGLLTYQRHMGSRTSALVEVNPGWPSPLVQAGARLDVWKDDALAWQIELSGGVQWPAWWRATCRLSACTDLEQRVVLVYLQLGTGVVLRLLPRHTLRVDVGLQSGARWQPLQTAGPLSRGVASLGYAFAF
jgi:hypothetical protein